MNTKEQAVVIENRFDRFVVTCRETFASVWGWLVRKGQAATDCSLATAAGGYAWAKARAIATWHWLEVKVPAAVNWVKTKVMAGYRWTAVKLAVAYVVAKSVVGTRAKVAWGYWTAVIAVIAAVVYTARQYQQIKAKIVAGYGWVAAKAADGHSWAKAKIDELIGVWEIYSTSIQVVVAAVIGAAILVAFTAKAAATAVTILITGIVVATAVAVSFLVLCVVAEYASEAITAAYAEDAATATDATVAETATINGVSRKARAKRAANVLPYMMN